MYKYLYNVLYRVLNDYRAEEPDSVSSDVVKIRVLQKV